MKTEKTGINCPVCHKELLLGDIIDTEFISRAKSQPDLLASCKRDKELATAAISATPTGEYRNKLTEINILRLQAIAKAKNQVL